MASPHLRLSDTDIVVGDPFLAATHPSTPIPSSPVPTTMERIERLEQAGAHQYLRILQLEQRVLVLENGWWQRAMRWMKKAIRKGTCSFTGER